MNPPKGQPLFILGVFHFMTLEQIYDEELKGPGDHREIAFRTAIRFANQHGDNMIDTAVFVLKQANTHNSLLFMVDRVRYELNYISTQL